MFSTHRKMARYENRSNNQQKSQSIETDPEMTQMIELVNKDIRIYPHMFKKVEESMNIISKVEERRTKQIQLLEMKSTITNKNTLVGISGRIKH